MDIDADFQTRLNRGSPEPHQHMAVALPSQDLQGVNDVEHPALGNANRIVRICTHIRLPKDSGILRQFLRDVLPNTEIKRAAQLVLNGFVNHLCAITTDSEEFSSPKIAWSLGFAAPETSISFPTRHTLSCRSSMNPLYGGIFHHYVCVTCSQDAAVELALIAESDGATVRSPRHWKSTDLQNTEAGFWRLESVGARTLTMMALQRRQWIFATAKEDSGSFGVGWRVQQESAALIRLVEQTIEGLTSDQLSTVFGEAIKQTESSIVAHEDRSISAGLREQIDTRSIDGVPGILVKGKERPLSEGTSSCFFVFDDQFMGEGAANLLQATRQANAVYEQNTAGSWVRCDERGEVDSRDNEAGMQAV